MVVWGLVIALCIAGLIGPVWLAFRIAGRTASRWRVVGAELGLTAALRRGPLPAAMSGQLNGLDITVDSGEGPAVRKHNHETRIRIALPGLRAAGLVIGLERVGSRARRAPGAPVPFDGTVLAPFHVRGDARGAVALLSAPARTAAARLCAASNERTPGNVLIRLDAGVLTVSEIEIVRTEAALRDIIDASLALAAALRDGGSAHEPGSGGGGHDHGGR